MPRGCLRELFWRHSPVFRGMIFTRNFGHVSGRLFHASTFGLLRASFSRPFGGSRLWQKQYPRLHGSYVFDVLSGQKHGFFRHRFRRGSRRRFFRVFSVVWAPLGHPSAPLWAPLGAHSADGFRRDFGCRNDRFLWFPAKGGNASSSSGWPRARKEIDFVP